MIAKATGEAKGGPLRQRMIERIRMANPAENTQSAHLSGQLACRSP